VTDVAATVENNQVSHWRVTVKVSFLVQEHLHE
jgi:flavin-binding protein dodecin